jgi:hypothetical protein
MRPCRSPPYRLVRSDLIIGSTRACRPDRKPSSAWSGCWSAIWVRKRAGRKAGSEAALVGPLDAGGVGTRGTPGSAFCVEGNALASWRVRQWTRAWWPPRAEQSSASGDRRAVAFPARGRSWGALGGGRARRPGALPGRRAPPSRDRDLPAGGDLVASMAVGEGEGVAPASQRPRREQPGPHAPACLSRVAGGVDHAVAR